MKRTLAVLVLMAGSAGSAGCGGSSQSPAARTPAPTAEPSPRAAVPSEPSVAVPSEPSIAVPAEPSTAAPAEQSAANTPNSTEPGPEPPRPTTSPASVASSSTPPNGNVTLRSVSVSGAAVPYATFVVAGMRAQFRNCYNRSLRNDPETSGGLHLTLNINADGRVHDVDAVPSGRLPEALVHCVRARAQAAWFSLAAGAARVSVPITFATQ